MHKRPRISVRRDHTGGDLLRHVVSATLRDMTEVAQHHWLEDAPDGAERPWTAIEIQLRRNCDARCAHEVERRLLSTPGVNGLGPHWPRPDRSHRILFLRLYRAR